MPSYHGRQIRFTGLRMFLVAAPAESSGQNGRRLGVTQAYLNYLEHGKSRLTAHFVRRAASVYGLAPTSLPVTNAFAPFETTDQHLAESLSTLGYPGFSYL